MFHEDRCDYCGECLSRCKYLEFDKESGSAAFRKLAAGEKSEWIYDCVTCMACDEYCPTKARPFDLIMKRMEEVGDFTDPKMRADMAARFKPEGEPKPMPPAERAMSICVMQGNMPWAVQGQLFETIPLLKGKHYFCNVLFAHMGDESVLRERLQGMVDSLAKSGAKEIVFVHDDCYAALKGVAPELGIKIPFRPVHIFEHLRDVLKEKKGKLKKLNMKVAYQRPCASRYTPEKDPLVDEIFELIGVERMKRQYEGIDALCCGVEVAGPGLKLFPRGKNYEPFRVKNIEDAKASGAEAMVYLCPMCFAILNKKVREAGMKNYMISDICRLALGEELPAEKPA
jgi:Fe-S oxidoreductase